MVIAGIVGFVLLGCFLFAVWFLPRYANSVVQGKVPRLAAASVLKKECSVPEADSVGTRRCRVWYRLEEFYGVPEDAREAVIAEERKRFSKGGARVREVSEEEFRDLQIGQWFPIRYAYYPAVFWGVSGDIRVPW